jgi:hypothetical protein
MSPEPLVTFPVCRSKSINALKTSIWRIKTNRLRNNIQTMIQIIYKICHYQNTMKLHDHSTYLDILLPFLKSLNQFGACLLHHTKACQLKSDIVTIRYMLSMPREFSQNLDPQSHHSKRWKEDNIPSATISGWTIKLQANPKGHFLNDFGCMLEIKGILPHKE